MHSVILAAGRGSRLNHSVPKPLVKLITGESILGRQLRLLRDVVPPSKTVLVVGHQRDLIIGAFPGCIYVVNDRYADTNTAKSLELGLKTVGEDDVLFLNGDVVFEAKVIEALVAYPSSGMAVNRERCGDEEVKYLANQDGMISAVSKAVTEPLGEALGVNMVRRADFYRLLAGLAECNDTDYFERGIELAISRGARFGAVDVTGCTCVEVDYPADLQKANAELALGCA